jgi:hypothetical protein
MDPILESIRLAIADGASDAERASGAQTCRSLADTLDGAIVSVVPPTPADPKPPAAPPAEPVAPAVVVLAPFGAAGPLASNPFAGMTADQIFDVAIARLRGALGNDAPPEPAGPPFRVTLVTVPRIR